MKTENKSNSFFNKIADFEQFCSLHLNYLWIKKDYKTFIDCSKRYESEFELYKDFLSPHFKLEILLGFTRMYFEMGKLNKADAYSTQIISERSNPTSTYLACGNLINIMINVDLGHFKLLPHLINRSKYFLKNRERLFEIERLFLKYLKQLKPYYNKSQKKSIYQKLFEELNAESVQKQEGIINNKIRYLNWLESKVQS